MDKDEGTLYRPMSEEMQKILKPGVVGELAERAAIYVDMFLHVPQRRPFRPSEPLGRAVDIASVRSRTSFTAGPQRKMTLHVIDGGHP